MYGIACWVHSFEDGSDLGSFNHQSRLFGGHHGYFHLADRKEAWWFDEVNLFPQATQLCHIKTRAGIGSHGFHAGMHYSMWLYETSSKFKNSQAARSALDGVGPHQCQCFQKGREHLTALSSGFSLRSRKILVAKAWSKWDTYTRHSYWSSELATFVLLWQKKIFKRLKIKNKQMKQNKKTKGVLFGFILSEGPS